MKPEDKSVDKDSVIRKLSGKVKALENKLELLEKKKWSEYIDEYIDTWFEENKEEVDIGRVRIGGMFEVDLLPDELEKKIYKKIFKIVYSLMKQKI